MSRKTKILKKKRLKSILKGDYETLDINDNYLIATCDYSKEQLNGVIIKEDSINSPLWDWFTLLNKKTKKIWYVDFSMPYLWKDFLDLPENKQIDMISKSWAIIDTPFKIKFKSLKGGFSEIYDEDPDYDLKLNELQKKYINQNDWKKTIQDFKDKNDYNENWNQGIQLYLNDKDDGFGIVVPHAFKDKTFLEIFTDVIHKFNLVKYNNDSCKLIEEITFKKFFKQ